MWFYGFNFNSCNINVEKQFKHLLSFQEKEYSRAWIIRKADLHKLLVYESTAEMNWKDVLNQNDDKLSVEIFCFMKNLTKLSIR